MFISKELDNHLKTSSTIKTSSSIFLEWNLNDLDNVENLGNYRYRPGTTDDQFSFLPVTYDPFDEGNYYTGATDAEIKIQEGFDQNDIPVSFTSKNEKMKLLYSLDDCIRPNRPRSGINKLLYLGNNANQFLDIGNKSPEQQEFLNISRRPRYYMASRKDQFKYWTSYRTEVIDEEEKEFGVSRNFVNDVSYIYDAAPFVVYKKEVAANRIVVKMQSHVGDIDLGTFRTESGLISDPLFGYQNSRTPVRWKIEILKNEIWEEAISFDEFSVDEDGNPIIKSDGYVEISYGIRPPEQYANEFYYKGELPNESLLPESEIRGVAYLIIENEGDRGIIKYYTGSDWIDITPAYTWGISENLIDVKLHKVTKLSDPDYFIDGNNENVYREFDFIRGIRVSVESMNLPDSTFDLIEMSPRLFAEITDRVETFNIKKTMSDLGSSSVPVGDLLASTGSISIFNDDFAFNPTNLFNKETGKGSISAGYLDTQTKFLFYQAVEEVDGFDFLIPIKTMYADQIPSVSSSNTKIDINLRDYFFLLESMKAPEILITDCSISYAITLLLDYMGFSNYVFKRIFNKSEIIIPFFFVGEEKNVAEVLKDLAIASQTAMFFDEYNNLVVMSKEYLLPEENERPEDSFFVGQDTAEDNQGRRFSIAGFVYDESEIPEEEGAGAYINLGDFPNTVYFWEDASKEWVISGNLEKIYTPNIKEIASEERKVFNAGELTYTRRYIQRAISKYRQTAYVDKFTTYGYKPSLLWEVSGREISRAKNEAPTQSQGFTLSALPLNTSLSDELPRVVDGEIVNNVIDVGENIDAGAGGLSDYKGYLYANGEIIKFDAIEYAISGPLDDEGDGNLRWITSNQDYQRYFSRLPFNGKMYPTGNIRIYSEPEYEIVDGETRMKEGDVKKNGRGQFGTPVTSHEAGLDSYWSSNENVKGCLQQTEDYLFNISPSISYPELFLGTAGKFDETVRFFNSDLESQSSTRNGIIKNFRADKYYTEEEVNYFSTARVGTIQSSALVFTGPTLDQDIPTESFVSYVKKDLPDYFTHFGTRIRIVGRVESSNQKSQTPYGAFPIYDRRSLNVDDPSKNIRILGGAGGLAFNINPETNNGYYFEIVSLSEDNLDQYSGSGLRSSQIYDISDTPAAKCVNNIVTVNTNQDIEFKEGDRVFVFNLVDELDPTNSRTPLNGEYEVVFVSPDRRIFQYRIDGEPIQDREALSGGNAQLTDPGPGAITNVFFYKILADQQGKAIPFKLWSGTAKILTDDGKFTGQYRLSGEENPTVYDLSAEYISVGNSKRFFLYLNGNQIATVTDENPLPEYNNMALFVRGSSRCMFENVYALGNNIGQNSKATVATPISKIWGDSEIDSSEALRKYALSGVIQKTYLSGIGSEEPPSHKIYFDEFGTILREAAYFDIKYDRAFPALYARLMKTLNQLKGYAVSGFFAGSYGADFLIFNCMDTNINLDDTSGNFLRIQGIAFTQNTTNTLTVEKYYESLANFSNPAYNEDRTLISPLVAKDEYNRILNSKTKYGENNFTITSEYIQTDEAAEEIFGWIMDKVSQPRLLVGIESFATFNYQLGDLVSINYKNTEGLDILAPENKKFIIYNVEHSKDQQGEKTTVYLVEA